MGRGRVRGAAAEAYHRQLSITRRKRFRVGREDSRLDKKSTVPIASIRSTKGTRAMNAQVIDAPRVFSPELEGAGAIVL